jgi:hypothetical protein
MAPPGGLCLSILFSGVTLRVSGCPLHFPISVLLGVTCFPFPMCLLVCFFQIILVSTTALVNPLKFFYGFLYPSSCLLCLLTPMLRRVSDLETHIQIPISVVQSASGFYLALHLQLIIPIWCSMVRFSLSNFFGM